jgi:hypothetical protein
MIIEDNCSMAVLSLPVTTQRIGYKDIAFTAQACIEQKSFVVLTLGKNGKREWREKREGKS